MTTGRCMLWSVLAAMFAQGCGLFFPAPTPVPTLYYHVPSGVRAEGLLVLLPGRADRAETFATEGIIEIAKQTSPALQVVAVDATLGYYVRRSIAERLDIDVVGPARVQGFRSIWLTGVSMGGLGALLYAQLHPEAVTGVLAVAPFLGNDEVIEEIERAGGVANWSPPAVLDPEDFQRSLWSWLKSCHVEGRPCPRIFLGYGEDDRFSRGHRLLASVLPARQVMRVPGGHAWGPWREVYAAMLPHLVDKPVALGPASVSEPKPDTSRPGAVNR